MYELRNKKNFSYHATNFFMYQNFLSSLMSMSSLPSFKMIIIMINLVIKKIKQLDLPKKSEITIKQATIIKNSSL